MAMKWLLYVKKEKIEYKKETSRIRRLILLRKNNITVYYQERK
jgi:hypothetical protein